ncbi:MAG: hypothetical protein H6922_06150 [Pseudomonadaceae bacterium]|nr:hypothetical protein [Pseudomonadaceae bacterium]
MNSAYAELMDEVVPFLPQALQVREDVVTDGAGEALLAAPVYKLVRAVERGHKQVLAQATMAELLDAEVAGVTGAPAKCFVQGDKLKVFPAAAVEVSVLYVPQVTPLMEDDVEEAVLLPASLHQVLVWGGLVWSALYDRGFLSQSELVMYQRQWQAGKEQVKLAMFGSGGGVRTVPYKTVC